MSSVEIFVVIVCVWLGYLIVAHFMEPKKKDAFAEGAQHARASGASAAPAEAPPDRPAWWQVLEVMPSATLEEIRAAYKSQIGKYHPDKVASLGAELQEVAERKSKEIAEAYREAVEIRARSS